MAKTFSIQSGATTGLGYQHLVPLVEAALRGDAPVLLRGHPGVGKSAPFACAWMPTTGSTGPPGRGCTRRFARISR